MGQSFCKDCNLGSLGKIKKNAVTWGSVSWKDDRNGSVGSSSPSHSSESRSRRPASPLDRKRSERVLHKKRNIALHAEFRDRHGILAPPLVCEEVMKDTDNVFCGQDLGVDDLTNGLPISSVDGKVNGINGHHHAPQSVMEGSQKIFEKTPQESAFIDEALSDVDNFVFEGIPDHLRQKLKDSLEKITVPKNTLLIRKGDNPDYLYLIVEGEVSVYIDPDEYVDENAMEIGKHAPIDISLKSERRASSSTLSTMSHLSGKTPPVKRDFKQSYVLVLPGKDNFIANGIARIKSSFMDNQDRGSILGQVFSVSSSRSSTRDSRMSALSANVSVAALLEESSTSDEDADSSLTLMNDLKGLKHERDLGPKDVFGELALIYGCPRTASCVSATGCILYRVDGDSFRRILSSSNTDRVKKRGSESKAAMEALHNVGVADELDEKTLKAFGSALSPIVFDEGDHVITKNTYNNLMCFVMSGKVLLHDIGTGDSRKVDLEIGEGGHFGEMDLLLGCRSAANVTVITPTVKLMAISKKKFNSCRETLEPLMRKLWLRNILLSIPLIANSKLLPHEINRLVQKLEPLSLPKGKVHFTDKMKSALIIIMTGKMQMTLTQSGDGVVNTFEPSDHFGGRSLFDAKFFERENVEVEALLPTECMVLSRNSLCNVIGRMSRLGKPSIPVSRKLDKHIKLSDLKLHRILGVGMFGRVWLVQHKGNDTVYALKVMDKEEIVKRKMSKGVIREKNVMASVQHPFLADLIAAFQDEHYLYMLQNYIQGGELFGLIYSVSKKGYLSNDAAAFYGAGIVEGLNHLHSRHICHRDIKPENILINAAGYAILIDFGFSKVVLDKTFTTCGSPEYMAPEILLGRGHSLSVDHWSLGVVLYEMLVGQTPFIHVGATRMTLFRRICNGVFAFPSLKKHGMEVQSGAKLLIKGLLNKNSEDRIGSSLKLGDEEIRTNPWFQGLLTEHKDIFFSERITPPWLPDLNDELDASYFSSHEKVEEAVMCKKQKPLDKKLQRVFEGF